MTHWLFSRLSADTAENSIMQTITIAVSAILIAAGLITAPGLINNARDNNTREDLSNIAYAEAVSLSDRAAYFHLRPQDGQPDVNPKIENIAYTVSATSSSFKSIVCEKPQEFLLEAQSPTGKTFYRYSEQSGVVSDIAKLNLSECIKAQMPSGPIAGAVQVSMNSAPVYSKSATATDPEKYMSFFTTTLSGVDFASLPKLTDATVMPDNIFFNEKLDPSNPLPTKWVSTLKDRGYDFKSYGFKTDFMDVNYNGKSVMRVDGTGVIKVLEYPNAAPYDGSPYMLFYVGPEINETDITDAIGGPANPKRLSFSVEVEGTTVELIPPRPEYSRGTTTIDTEGQREWGGSDITADFSLAMSIDKNSNVVRSTDGGITYTTQTVPMPDEQRQSSSYAYRQLAIAPDKTHAIMMIANELDTVYVSSDAGITWSASPQSEYRFTAVAYSGATLYALGYKQGDFTYSLLKSTNNGASWVVETDNAEVGETGWNYAFKLISTGGDDLTVMSKPGDTSGELGVYRTQDGGQNWTSQRLEFPGAGMVTVSAVQASADGQTIQLSGAGPDGKSAQVSFNGGKDWTLISPQSGQSVVLFVDKQGVLYKVTADANGVPVSSETTRDGATWNAFAYKLPSLLGTYICISEDGKRILSPPNGTSGGSSWLIYNE